MIEDQVAPKRCGHTRGKQVVDRREALSRIRAAVDTRDSGADILILARTDARATDGMDEALWRARAFEEAGADIVFLEAPQSEGELEQFCRAVRVPKLVNMLEGGKTPLLELARLETMGFKIAAFPLTLLNASIAAMQAALASLAERRVPDPPLTFEAIKEVVGFNEYYALERKYADD